MKLKGILTSFIAGVSLFTTGNITPAFADSCETAPPTGTVFKWTGPGTWKIMTTVRQPITSVNERKVEFAYKKLDLKAQRELARFVETKVENASNLTEAEKATFVVGTNDDVSEDSLEGFEEFVDTFSSSTDALLVGMVDVGRCHTFGEEVRLTKGINSENAVASQRMKNQDFGGSTSSINSINSSSPSQTYRRDLNKGYSGYGNLDNF